MEERDYISIRTIQHYLYCPHRWGLIEIERAWAENYFVVKANSVHERAHSNKGYSLRGKEVHTAVKVWNDELELYGEVDCLEAFEGILTIVEYKPTHPKDGEYRFDDAMQVFAQKVCVDSVFDCDCNTVIYYADTRKRVELPLKEAYEDYYSHLAEILSEMRRLRTDGIIPPVKKGQNCNGCSMRDLCLPSAFKRRKGLRDELLHSLEEEI